jgi:ABC-2 type transport system permease protein
MNPPTVLPATGPAASAPARSLWRIYVLEARYELLKQIRLPAYAVPTLVFPLVFYLLFGVALRHGPAGPFDLSTYLLATYGAFGVMNTALFAFGVGVAAERGQGWMLFKRATPMPPFAHFAGKLAMSLAFALTMVGLLFLLGATAGGVRLTGGTWLSLAAVLVAGALPFAAFGLAVGYWAGPNSAVAVLNLLALSSAFGSGMWIPLQVLPPVVRKIALVLPPYHYAQLALRTLGLDAGGRPVDHVAFLAAFTLASLLLAWIGYRRDEGRTFG